MGVRAAPQEDLYIEQKASRVLMYHADSSLKDLQHLQHLNLLPFYSITFSHCKSLALETPSTCLHCIVNKIRLIQIMSKIWTL